MGAKTKTRPAQIADALAAPVPLTTRGESRKRQQYRQARKLSYPISPEAQRLRELIGQAGITVKEAATRLDIPYSTLKKSLLGYPDIPPITPELCRRAKTLIEDAPPEPKMEAPPIYDPSNTAQARAAYMRQLIEEGWSPPNESAEGHDFDLPERIRGVAYGEVSPAIGNLEIERRNEEGEDTGHYDRRVDERLRGY